MHFLILFKYVKDYLNSIVALCRIRAVLSLFLIFIYLIEFKVLRVFF